MNAYPTCADWTDLDKEVERVSREVMEDIDQMIFLSKRIDSIQKQITHLPYPYGVIPWVVEFNKTRLQMALNYTRQYHELQYKKYPLYNLASYHLQNYYMNHHIDPRML